MQIVQPLTLGLLAFGLMAQNTTELKAYGTTGAGKRKLLQHIVGDTQLVYDTDGSIFYSLDRNTVRVNNAAGAKRVSFTGSGIPDCGVLSIHTGPSLSETTPIDLRCAGLTIQSDSTPFVVKNAAGVTQFTISSDTGQLQTYDADGSIYASLSDNILRFNNAAGSERILIGGNTLDDCGYMGFKTGPILSESTIMDLSCAGMTMRNLSGVTKMVFNPTLGGTVSSFQLRDGTNTGVVFQYAGAGSPGSFQLYDAAGNVGTQNNGGSIVTQQLEFGPNGFAPSGVGLTYPGNGSGLRVGVPSSLGSVGQVWGLTGANQLGWITVSAGGVTSITGAGPISASSSTGAITLDCALCLRTDIYQTINNDKTFSQRFLDFRNGANGQMVTITPNGLGGFGGNPTGVITVSGGSGSFTTNYVTINTLGPAVTNGAIYWADGLQGWNGICAGLDFMRVTKGIITGCNASGVF